MAILQCPQCGNKVSDKAEKCPHCGKMVSDFLALENSYQEAINIFQSNSSTSADIMKAKTIFIQLKNYKNSNKLIEKCDEAIAELPLKEIYQQSENWISEAKSLYDTSVKENVVKAVSKLEQAEKSFIKLNKFQNSTEKAAECRAKIQTYQEKIGELDELNKKSKQAKKLFALISVIVIAAIILTVKVIIPPIRYNNAVAMLENGQYDEAIASFTNLGNYKDSINKITETQKAKTKFEILNLSKNGQISEAFENFKSSEFSNSSNFATFMKDNGYQSQIEAYLNDFRKYEGLYLNTENTVILSTSGLINYYEYYNIYIDEDNWKFSVHHIVSVKKPDPYESANLPETFAYDFQLGKTRYYSFVNETSDTYDDDYYEIDVNNGVLVNKYGTNKFKYAYKQ